MTQKRSEVIYRILNASSVVVRKHGACMAQPTEAMNSAQQTHCPMICVALVETTADASSIITRSAIQEFRWKMHANSAISWMQSQEKYKAI
jgi:hypothetical protein